VHALSQKLNVQILIFTRQKGGAWRFDAREGVVDCQNKVQDKKVVLLYYNGVNHYQNLIPINKPL